MKSPAATTLDKLKSDAYSAAQVLPNVSQVRAFFVQAGNIIDDVPILKKLKVANDIDLKNALQQYGGPIFKTDFGYDCQNGRPSDAATDEKEPIYARSEDIAYMNTRTLKDGQAEAYVKLHVME